MKSASKKLTVVWSPSGGTGTSTVASCLSILSAQKGYFTALIELNRYCGTVPYMLNTFSEKSLKKAVDEDNERDILKNFEQNPENEKLFSLSLNTGNSLDDLYIFPVEKIQKIIQVARMNFDRIFIDVPSNYIETGFIAAIESVPDRFIQVMDNNLATWHKLKLYDMFLQEYDNISVLRPITIINKDEELLPSGWMQKMEKSLKVLSIKDERTFFIPYYERFIKECNEGISFVGSITGNSKESKILKAISGIEQWIEDDSAGKLKITLKG